jgi:hypothetical protein
MRHRDPNLFYLTMEVTVRKAGKRTYGHYKWEDKQKNVTDASAILYMYVKQDLTGVYRVP